MGGHEGRDDIESMWTLKVSSADGWLYTEGGMSNPSRCKPREGGSAMTRTQVQEVQSQEFGTMRSGVVGCGCGVPQHSRVEGSEGRKRQ